MFTWNACYAIYNMIQHASSTHPHPWTTLTESAHLTFAFGSLANVLLVPIFRRQVPLAACPSPCKWRGPHQYMVHRSPFSSPTDLSRCPITLNESIIDKSLGQFLPKGHELQLWTCKMNPCEVGVHFCNRKNKCKHTYWPPIRCPCRLESKTLFLSTILTLVIMIVDATTVGIVVGDYVGVLESCRDNLTVRVLVMTSCLLLAVLRTRRPIRWHETHHVIRFFHAKKIESHAV